MRNRLLLCASSHSTNDSGVSMIVADRFSGLYQIHMYAIYASSFPSSMHRVIVFSSFAFYRCTPMQYDTSELHFQQRSIDVNRSFGRTVPRCVHSWTWPFFFSSAFLNIIKPIFANAPCAHIHFALCARHSNGKCHFDFTFAQTLFICLTFSISLFSPTNR